MDLFTDVPNSIGSIVSLTKYMNNDFKSPNDVTFLILSFDLELFGSDCGEKREQVAISDVCFRPQFVNLKLRYEDH